MLISYFKIAMRNLARQKALSFINIFGLSVGIACFSLCMFYTVNELNFDNFHANDKNIYRVYQWKEAVGENKAEGIPYHPMPLAPAMKTDLPGIENYVRFLDNWGTSFIKTDNAIFREKVSFADPSFFSVFSFKLKYGNAATALQDLHGIVLTEESANRIFGDANAIGKIINIKNGDKFEAFTVTAIAENLPSNSSIQFTMLGNFNYFATTEPGSRGVNNWNQISYQTFVQLKQGSKLAYNKKLLAEFRKKYYPDEEANARKLGWIGSEPPSWYGLQHLNDIHTNIDLDGGVVASVDPKTIWILLSIATGVLLIACTNFTTLSIGRSAGRSKEVGVRKVIGGNNKSLIIQFLTESLLLTFLSTIFGLLIANILLPYFNQLSGRQLSFSLSQFPQLLWLTIGLVFVVSILAGSYPAFVLSRLKASAVLKKQIKLGGFNLFTRSLVTVQFIVSATLIISTVIIVRQLHYMQSKNPGFDKENVVVVDARGLSGTKRTYKLLKQELSANPEIIGMASAQNGLGKDEGSMQTSFKYNDKDKQVYEYFVDPDYVHLLGMQLLGGRNLDPTIASDTITSVIINEAMMNDLGLTLANAVGQKLKGYNGNNNVNPPVVIGIVKNFNYLDMRHTIQPQMFQQFSGYEPNHFFVRIRPGDPSNALAALKLAWGRIAPDYPLKYNFLDDNLDRFYQAESRWSNIVGWAGGISIFLACLGLLGLAALAAVNRTKEIGIRKVLGASIVSIMKLLSADFLRLIVIALVIALPIAWYLMDRWLESYAYRIRLEWWVFALTSVGIVAIVILTLCSQVIRAGMSNPVSNLRTE